MDTRAVLTIDQVSVDLGNEWLMDGLGNRIALRRQSFAVLRHLIVAEDLENRATVRARKLTQDQIIRFQDRKRLEPKGIHLLHARQKLIWA